MNRLFLALREVICERHSRQHFSADLFFQLTCLKHEHTYHVLMHIRTMYCLQQFGVPDGESEREIVRHYGGIASQHGARAMYFLQQNGVPDGGIRMGNRWALWGHYVPKKGIREFPCEKCTHICSKSVHKSSPSSPLIILRGKL